MKYWWEEDGDTEDSLLSLTKQLCQGKVFLI